MPKSKRSAGPQGLSLEAAVGAGVSGGPGQAAVRSAQPGVTPQLRPTARLPELALVPHSFKSRASRSGKTGFLAPRPQACRYAAPAPLGQQPRPPLPRCSRDAQNRPECLGTCVAHGVKGLNKLLQYIQIQNTTNFPSKPKSSWSFRKKTGKLGEETWEAHRAHVVPAHPTSRQLWGPCRYLPRPST